jgi:tRNA(Ile)-lysidine synthase
MAGSTTPRSAEPRRFAVAVSGGRDSTALWHAAAHAAASAGLEVVALHVHHGLQPQADAWVAHLQRQTRRWAASGLPVTLQWRRLLGVPAAGESIEAWARRERYAALGEMARASGIDLVLLAHHRRDQAETFLLQALRGAGPAGLAAMPREAVRDGITWARPWLEQPHEAVEAYVRRHRLSHVDDPSNADTRLSRNRLRHSVWPQLAAGFEAVETCLAATAKRAQEAAACLKELAAQDLHAACKAEKQLDIACWLSLSEARRANLLRAWLGLWQPGGVAESLVQRLLTELPRRRAARWPCVGGQLRRHDGLLSFHGEQRVRMLPLPAASMRIDLSRIGWHAVPAWGGGFEVQACSAYGLAPEVLRECELRARAGGERFQRAPGALPRSLKKEFQSAKVPAWLREGPLLYATGTLLYVPGLGIDARRHATAGAPALVLRWFDGEPGPP